MKKYKILYYAGAGLSLLVGLWHFAVPRLFEWSFYIPAEYENLSVAVDWVNMCFSLLLSGVSALVLLWGRKVFASNREAITVHGFLTVVWLFRVAIAIIEPWPAEHAAAVAYGQLAGAALISALLLAPLIKILFSHKK